jgi:GcrA cell cycle regulator
MDAIWTNERIEQLTKLWADGLSATAVAVEMGCFSHCHDHGRCAVTGKIYRLKLPTPPSKQVVAGLHREPRPPKPGTFKPQQRRNPSNYDILAKIALAAADPGLPEDLVCDEFDGTGIKLVDLLDNSCRFPRGDPKTPEFEYCGAPAVEGKPFCARCCRIVYQTPYYRDRADEELCST